MSRRLTTHVLIALTLIAAAEAVAQTNNPSATFMQGRVNLPHAMYNKGYYVVGSFQGTQNFGQVEKCDQNGEYCQVISRMLLTSRGPSDAYLVHYDANDKAQWAVKIGGSGEDKGRALAVDPADGNVVAFGFFSGVARFGHMKLKSTKPRLDCAHGCAAFIVKFLKDGRALWVREMGQSVHVGPQDAATKSNVNFWDARALEFLNANPEPEFNLDFYSDKQKSTRIVRNPEDLDKYHFGVSGPGN